MLALAASAAAKPAFTPDGDEPPCCPPARSALFSIAVGYHTGPAATLIGRLGYAWGRQERGHVASYSVHHLAIAPRLVAANAEHAAVSLLFGHTWWSVAGITIEGGVDARFTGDRAAGPAASLKLRLASFFLFAQGSVYLPEGDGNLALGIGVDFDSFDP